MLFADVLVDVGEDAFVHTSTLGHAPPATGSNGDTGRNRSRELIAAVTALASFLDHLVVDDEQEHAGASAAPGARICHIDHDACHFHAIEARWGV